MKLSNFLLAAPAAALLLLAGCAAPETAATSASTPGSSASASAEPEAREDTVVGTIVRFTGESNSVDVTIDQDTPAVRDFLSMLPLTLDLEEFNGREKIAYLPRELNTEGTPGSDPEDGDLIYYTPWGNLGFYYNTAGIGYSDSTPHIGVYTATLDELDELQGSDVMIEVAE